MHELTFVDQVTTWIDEILHRRLDLPFARAKIEESTKGNRKRRDLTLYDRDGKLALTGEIKLPDKPDGITPYNEAVVVDAHHKADEVGADYFFTWNVNKLVLWKTFESGKPLIQRDQRMFEVLGRPVHDNKQLSSPVIQDHIRRFLEEFLDFYRDLYSGVTYLRVKPLDERFIDMLDAALDTIVFHVVDALYQRYQSDLSFRAQLIEWMVQEMGRIHSEEMLDVDLEQVARTSSYRLINKLMFYNALRRQYQQLPALSFGPLDDTGDAMQQTLRQFFERAMLASGDYETVYLHNFADELPFLSPVALAGWRTLVEQIDAYDFTRLDYDVVGRIFERLISPEERHRYGQHYTMPDLVDLINAFCIRKAEDVVLDPACGGGTFLVRAYARKRHLSDHKLSHAALLDDLYGIDISPFAAHLTLINLASRNLENRANYPLVAVEDFFHARRDRSVWKIPAHGALRVEQLGGEQQVHIALNQVDAIVGNPPYIRQEQIDEVLIVKNEPKKSYKTFLKELFREEWGTQMAPLSARSDIYVHFWPHSAHFLREGGYIGFLTGSGWLDNEYGFRLQEWMLRHFQVLAVIETVEETWFSEARVNTAATILRRTSDAQARADNFVRFIMLRQRLGELLPQAEGAARYQAIDALVREIEGLNENQNNERWRVRVVPQSALTLDGWEFPDDVEAPTTWNGDWTELEAAGGRYTGTKWSIHLRAPSLYFDLLDSFSDRLVSLRDVAAVRYGIKSGADRFFYVEDVTDSLDPKTLAERYNLSREQTDEVRVVEAGDGSRHLIEARYLEPLIFSVMELDGPSLELVELNRCVLLVDGPREMLQGTHVLSYIRYGEQAGYNNNQTCQQRVIPGVRSWYELRDVLVEGDVVWPKAHQYRHIVSFNPANHPVNCRLYAIKANEGVDAKVLGALLNSTFIAWLKEIYGRVLGREGNTDTMVFEVKQMLVPDTSNLSDDTCHRLCRALDRLMRRRTLPFFPMGDELEQADRVELDNAVFEALGVISPEEQNEWRERLYEQVRLLHKQKRELEEEAQVNRVKAARTKRTASARTLAKEIWRELDSIDFRRFPSDFVPPNTPTKAHQLPEGEVQVGREMFTGAGALGVGYIMIGDELREVGSLCKAEFVRAWQEAGNHGTVQIPVDDNACQAALDNYHRYRAATQDTFFQWASSRTADERLQHQIVALLWRHAHER